MITKFPRIRKRYFRILDAPYSLLALLFVWHSSVFAQTSNGLRAEYYSNTQLGLTAATTKTDAVIDFDWANGAPLPAVGTDRFSVRWVGKVRAPVTGAYTFATYSDDGVRLWVNKKLVINNWSLHGVTRNASSAIQLTANQQYDISVEYYENYGSAVAKLLWSYPGQTEQIIPSSALSPAAPLSITAKQAARFLMQTTFGPKPAEITRVQAIGYSAWIDEQFNTPSTSYYAPLANLAGDDVFNQGKMDREVGKHTIAGQDQLRQRVAYALSQIMVVSFLDGELQANPKAIGGYMETLQRSSFLTYRQLLENVTLSHAMGLYLDMLKNNGNDPGVDPNENYSREVLQLFSVGMVKLNQDGTPQRTANNQTIPTYGQPEVKGFAKVFTGWSWGGDFGNWYYPIDGKAQWDKPMKFYPEYHSANSKVLLDNVVLPAGQTGQQDLKQALDNIANHPNVAPFISKQLIQRLVTSNPSPAYVGRISAKFNNNGSNVRGDLKAVVKAILLDAEARNPVATTAAARGKLREPLIRYLHLLRGTNATSTNGVYPLDGLASTEYGVGQLHFYSPSVFNFYPPDFAPQGLNAAGGDELVAPEFKITTDTQIINSANVAIGLIYAGRREYDDAAIVMDYSLLLSKAGNPAELTNTLETIFVPSGFSQETRQELTELIAETDSGDPAQRVKNALYLLIMTPDFAVER